MTQHTTLPIAKRRGINLGQQRYYDLATSDGLMCWRDGDSWVFRELLVGLVHELETLLAVALKPKLSVPLLPRVLLYCYLALWW